MTISSRDYKSVLEVIEIAYTIKDRQEMFSAVCEKLHKLINISSAVHLPMEPATRNFRFVDHAAYNIKPEHVLMFCLYYAPTHPYGQSGQWVHNINKAVRITDVIAESKLKETEYSNDFMALQPAFYELCCMLGSQGDPVGIFGLHRSKGERDFKDREKKIMDLLLPHISRSFHNLSLIDSIAGDNGIGIFEITPDGKTHTLNRQAELIIKEGISGGIPAPGTGAMPTFFKTNYGIYRVRSLAFPGQKTKTIILEPQPSWRLIETKIAHIGLSARQLEVVKLVAMGYTNRDIAEALQIAEQTVKDHLGDIFDKTLVRNRNELTSRILRLLFSNGSWTDNASL